MARWVATNAGRMARDACHQIMSTDGFDGYQQINWIPTEDRFQSLSVKYIAMAIHMLRAFKMQLGNQLSYNSNLFMVRLAAGNNCVDF